jgi:hypothetical protein
MVERRNIGDRRMDPSRQRQPIYCTSRIADRRQNNLPTVSKHWTEYDIDLITRYLTDKLVS